MNATMEITGEILTMLNLRIEVQDQLLARARARAAERNECIDELLVEYLRTCGASVARRSPYESFLELARRSTAGSGPHGRDWTREDLYRDI